MDGQGPSLREALIVWILYALVIAAIFVTYSRVSPTQMYNVSNEGIAGGASRVLTFSNFSLCFGALAVLGFVVARLISAGSSGHRRIVLILAAIATLLCLVTAFPGVVDQSDLDAKPINAVPALGVLLVIGLTIYAVRTRGVGEPVAWNTGDRLRLLAIFLLPIASLPWILADLGVYVGDIPPLDHVFMSKQIPKGETLRAVHLGHHHGLDGAFLAISALILGRELGRVRQRWLRTTLSWYLALMVAYGVANMINDAWLEQVVKRGWTHWQVPDMLRPQLSAGWSILLLGVVVLRFLVFRPEVEESSPDVASKGKGLEPRGGIA
jgi:hypothetical protein